MGPKARSQLEARIEQEVETMMTEGDQNYLQSLSPSALLEAVENELRFLGLYSYLDHETPTVIHDILEAQLDAWCQSYLGATKVKIADSPLIQEISSESVGNSVTEKLHIRILRYR